MTDQLEAEIERILDQVPTAPATTQPIGPLVLFGAGYLGKVTLKGLRQIGIEPLAWADNSPQLHGTTVEGLPVYSAADAAAKFGPAASFVVTIYTGAGVRRQLAEAGLRVISVARLFRQFADTFLPYWCLDLPAKLPAHREDILKGARIWSDVASQQEYLAQIRFRAGVDDSVPAANSGLIYFPDDLVKPSENEVFVDCGAYDGDSLRTFLERTGSAFRQIVALEPDPLNFQGLKDFVARLPGNIQSKIQLQPVAVGSRRERLRFEAMGSVGSQVSNGGTYEVLSLPLDEILADCGVSWIKMDIEGSEYQALQGARNVIRKHRPVLGVCLYHRMEDLWKLPLFISAISDDYRFFLRRHSDDCWEQIVYAVPANRLISKASSRT
jgi:FkbM family methyltransferase